MQRSGVLTFEPNKLRWSRGPYICQAYELPARQLGIHSLPLTQSCPCFHPCQTPSPRCFPTLPSRALSRIKAPSPLNHILQAPHGRTHCTPTHPSSLNTLPRRPPPTLNLSCFLYSLASSSSRCRFSSSCRRFSS